VTHDLSGGRLKGHFHRMRSFTPRATAVGLRRFALVGLGLVLSVLSCGREVTGPGGVRLARNISFVGQFPGALAHVAEGAGSVVAFDRIRVVLRRSNGAVAIDRLVQFAAGVDSVALDLRVPLQGSSTEGEPLALNLAYLNTAGDTVFRGGPVSVLAVPQGSSSEPPAEVPVPLTYTGPGATAVSVQLLPDTINVLAGAPFAFVAIARDAQATVVTAPIVYRSLDTSRVVVPAIATAAALAREPRGIARITAELAAGSAPDTAVVIIAPRAGALVAIAGGAQSATAGASLADSVRVRLLATDGLALVGVPLTVSVTTGGGAVSTDTIVTDAAGDIRFAWTLGATVGAQSVTVRATGVPDLVVTATASEPPLVATQLVITQQPSAAQVVGVTLAPALRVEARDAVGVPVPAFTDSVTIAFGENPGAGTLSGTLRVAAINGIATFPGVSIGAVGSGYTLVASAAGLASDTTTSFDVGSAGPAALTVVSGDAQTGFVSQALASPIVVRVTDALAAPSVGATVTFAVVSGGGALTGTTATTNANGEAALGSWTLGATPGANSITANVAGIPALTLTATGTLPPPAIVLAVAGSNVVGFERAGTLNVQLLQPAPVGGLTVTLANQAPAVLDIAPPGSVDFTAGQTLRTIALSGLTIGNATVVATAPGYAPDTLVVPVSLNLISLPPSLTVPLAQTTTLPVQISTPAPAGGAVVKVVSSDPAIARPAVDSVIIAAGTSSVNATIEGLALGTVTFTASNPNYAQDVSTVRVAAELAFTATTAAANATFGGVATVRLESGGTPVAAPAGGIALDFTSRDATCAVAPATGTIDAGLVSTNVALSYGGTAALPCSTRIVVSGPIGFVTDSITVNMAIAPTFTRVASTLGHGLQRNIGASLTAANHGGVTVRVTSLDSSIVLVSPSVSTAGTGSYDTVILPGATSIPLVISAIPTGRVADTIAVRLEAPGFVTHVFNVTVFQPVFQLTGLDVATNPAAIDDAVYVSIGTPLTPAGTSIWNADDVRVGGGPIAVSFLNGAPGIATLVTSARTADSVVALIAEGVNTTPTTVAAGGVAVRPLATGTATISTLVPGSRALTAASGTVTITQAALTLAADYLGSGLQRARTISTPSAPAPAGGTPITITAARTGVVQFAPNATTAGVDTLVVVVPEGQTSASFYVQAADGIAQDSVVLTATAPGFTTATAMQRVWAAVYAFSGLNASGTPLTADDPFYVSLGSPNSAAGTVIWSADDRRAGAPPLDVSIVNSTPATGTLVRTGPVLADSVVVPIVPGVSNTPTSVAAGGVAFRYLAAGTTQVRATIPGAGMRALAGATANVTVNSTALTLANDYIGSGLQRSRTVGLSAPAPAGGVPVTITADRLGVVQFAPDASSLGTDTLVVTIPQGATTASFVVQGADGIIADTVLLSATSPGYASGSGEQRVWQGVVEFSGLLTGMTTLAADDPFTVSVGTPVSPAGTQIWSADARRFGSAPITATVTSATSTVAQLVSTARTGDTVTVDFASGQRTTPTTVALGGVAVQPLTTGTTVINVTVPGFRNVAGALGTTVTVTAPALTLNAITNVGAGLQVGASGSLNAAQHGGIDLVIRSSNPALVRVSASATVAATDSIIVPLANGVGSFSYIVAAEDGVTGTASITASAVGFTQDVATVTVVPSAIQLTGLVASRTAFGADDAFQVQVGIPVANNTALNVTQARRAGAAPLVVTLSSANAAVGTLVTTALVDDTVTVEIAGASSISPVSVATGGVAMRYLSAGTTVVRATHPTLPTMSTNGVQTVTVTAPTVTLAAIPTVGAGLQVAATGSLSGLQHGGTNVVIRSNDPSRVLVARNATELASDSIVIAVADGITAFSYVVAGVEGATGAPTLTAQAVGHTAGVQTATVVAPRLDISGLVTSRAAAGADDAFQVRVGIPNATNATLTTTQSVRFGVAPLTVTLTSSAPAVGTLTTTALTAGTLTVQIPAGASVSPATVALGGVAFRYLTAGTSTVQVSHASLLAATTAGTVTVTVTP
jgi:hypothetical protein